MRCNHCNTPMVLLREESTPRSVVKWHRCPTCGSAHLFSEPSVLETAAPMEMFARVTVPEFRSARSLIHSSAYSGPERRTARRG